MKTDEQIEQERTDRMMECTVCHEVKHVNDFDNCDVCTACANKPGDPRSPAGSEFCDGCCYLHPDEASQKRGEQHVCQLYGYVLRHYWKHPRIPKPENGCSGPYPLDVSIHAPAGGATERLKKALINIRDYDPGRCCGDNAMWKEVKLDYIYEQLDSVDDLISNDKHDPRAVASRAPCSCSAFNTDFAWYCPTCERDVQNEHVTFQEIHDPRCGGCGNPVQPKER